MVAFSHGPQRSCCVIGAMFDSDALVEKSDKSIRGSLSEKIGVTRLKKGGI